MKLLHLINIGGFGGAEKLLIEFLPELNRRAEVHCLLCYQPAAENVAAQIAKELNEQQVKAHLLPYGSPLGTGVLNGILQLLKTERFDLVHTHLRHANLWMSLLKWKRGVKLPVIATLHGYRDSYQNRYGLIFRKRALLTGYYWTNRFIFTKINGFILISNSLKDFYIKAGLINEKRAVVIYHGSKQSTAAREPAVNRPGVLKDPRIGIPGRLIRMKGHSFALKALRQLIEHHPGASLHIFGDGPERENIAAETSRLGLTERVHFHGYVHNLLDRLRECDLALIPSMYEAFGLVFLDAFSVGIPVVAFDLPAGNEIVEDGYNGLLAKPYDSQSLFECAVKVCNDEKERAKLIANAFTKLHRVYAMERMVDDYMNYYGKFYPGNAVSNGTA